MKKYKIYTLKCPLYNEVRYVGVTTSTLNSRLSQHIWDARNIRHTHKSKWIYSLLNKNLKPIIELIEEVNNNDWEEKERFWIKQFNNLTNHNEGGSGIILNRQFSGKERSQRSKFKPVYQFSIDMQFIKEWESAVTASKELNISLKSIYKCMSKSGYSNPTAGNYRWFRKEDYDSGNFIIKNRIAKDQKSFCKKIYIYDKHNNFLFLENSITNCANRLNIPRHAIDKKLRKGDVQIGDMVLSFTKK